MKAVRASRLNGLTFIAIAACGLALLPILRPSPYVESFLYLLFFWIALATSWTILSGFSGYVSFGHGAFYGAGVYTMANLGPHWPLPAAWLAAGLIAAALGALFGAVIFRVKRLRGELFALLTLSLAIVLGTIVLNTRIDGGPGISLMAVRLPAVYRNPSSTVYLLGLLAAAASLACAWLVQHSRFGRGLFAISDDEDVAETLGVPTYAFKVAALTLSALLAGLAGGVHALFVSYVTVGETFSITVPLFVLLMSVLGGARSWLGPAVGAVFVTTLTNLMVGGDWALAARAIIGLTLIVGTLYLPEGVIGYWTRRRHAGAAPQTGAAISVAGEAAAAGGKAQQINRTGIGGTLLSCRGIALAFRGVKALDGVSLDVRDGEILGLVGPNGSGKSTLINVLCGFYRPAAGAIEFAGRDITNLSGHGKAQCGISRTFQIPRPFARLTVLENVVAAAQFGARQLSYAQALATAHEYLAFVELEARAGALPAQLNLHQRKFLELARALASGAKLIMLDEVLAGLTPSEITAAIAMVRRIHANGATIIFVEHNMRAVLALTDRLIVLNQGRIIAQGAPLDVINDPAVITAYLGEPDAPG